MNTPHPNSQYKKNDAPRRKLADHTNLHGALPTQAPQGSSGFASNTTNDRVHAMLRRLEQTTQRIATSFDQWESYWRATAWYSAAYDPYASDHYAYTAPAEPHEHWRQPYHRGHGDAYGYDEGVGTQHMENAMPSVVELHGLPAGWDADGDIGGPFREAAGVQGTQAHAPVHATHVHEGPQGPAHTHVTHAQPRTGQHVPAVPGGNRRVGPDAPSEAVDSSAGGQASHQEYETRAAHCRTTDLEGVLPMDGGRLTDARQIQDPYTQPYRHRMGADNQERPDEAVQQINVHGNRGTMDARDLRGRPQAPTGATAHPNVSERALSPDEETLRPGVQLPQHQARSGDLPDAPSGRREADARGSSLAGEARQRRDDAQVRGGPGNNGPRAGHPKGHAIVVAAGAAYNASTDFDEESEIKLFLSTTNKHTITRMRRQTRVARGHELSLPFHMKPTSVFDLNMIRSWMNEATRTRFDYVWDLLIREPPNNANVRFYRALPDADATITMKCGVCELVTAAMEAEFPTTGTIIPWTNIEERDGAERRRLIGHTKDDNERLQKIYTAQVPLHHVSYYLERADAQCGGKRDYSCGFYGMGIPPNKRAKYRFRDESGRLYQMTRASMGHVTTCELMHTITATVAGDPTYCSAKHAISFPKLDVYIDGIRAAGTWRSVEAYFQKVDQRNHLANGTWKATDSYIGQDYTFDGVHFNHKTRKVSIGDKLVKKIASTRTLNVPGHGPQLPEKSTYGDIESLVARLMHGSAILGIPIPEYYPVVKYTRRRIAQMNHGTDPNTHLNIPGRVLHDLRRWIEVAVKTGRTTTAPRARPRTVCAIHGRLQRWLGRGPHPTRDGACFYCGKRMATELRVRG